MKSLKALLFLSLLMCFVCISCKKSEPFDEVKQFSIDENLIKDFLAVNNITNAVRDEVSGLYYVLVEPGSGSVIYSATTLIDVKYTGRLLNGQIFDSNNSAKFSLGSLIPGWQIGIQKIQKGGKIRLFVPSYYAYGPNPKSGIPANSVLDFDIELLDVNSSQ